MKRLVIAVAIIAIALFAFKSTASATTDIPYQGPIYVQLTVNPWTQIWFQDDNWKTPNAPDPWGTGANATDIDINFANNDYMRALADGLIGEYASTGDPTFGGNIGYFESQDGATIYMESNTNFSGTIACSGNLTRTTLPATTIPTWFTIAVTGYDKLGIGDNGFRLGNSGSGGNWVDDTPPPPGGSKGGYAGDNSGGAVGNEVTGNPAGGIRFGTQGTYPNQDAFQMIPSYTLAMVAPVGPGTMKFLARCKRTGVHDLAGTYAATITPTFTIP